MPRLKIRLSLILSALAACLPACSGISIAPSCPNELEVGQSGVILANEINPGAIPVYQWEVSPPDAGTIANPTLPSTTFTAETPGRATLILTASDGLFQVISQCTIDILSAGIVVTLTASARPTVNQTLTLTCANVGDVQAQRLQIDQLSGPPVTLTVTEPGVATTVPTVAGNYSFRCLGFDADDQPSEPAVLEITVSEGGRGGR